MIIFEAMLFRRKHISILLLALVLINTLSSVMVISSFYANQDFFAQNFCVNKTQPTLCAGSCYLTKVLKNLPDQQDEPVSLKISQISFEFITNSIFEINSLNTIIESNHYYTQYFTTYQSRISDLSTPPPQG